MINQFSRTELIFGKQGMLRLLDAKVAVFGVGGVGGYCAEALARAGIGGIDLFDDDKVCITNLNRQIHALKSTVGIYKVDAAKARIHDINPQAQVNAHRMFYMPENSAEADLSQYDYIADAIDTVTGKIELAVKSGAAGVPIISSMGAGNKVNAHALEVADIYETSVCPLAKVMRKELRERGIERLKVVYSKEPAIPRAEEPMEKNRRRQIPGSTSFVPPAAGLIMAGEIIKYIAGYAD